MPAHYIDNEKFPDRILYWVLVIIMFPISVIEWGCKMWDKKEVRFLVVTLFIMALSFLLWWNFGNFMKSITR